MSNESGKTRRERQVPLPSVEALQRELGKAESMDDFFGKECIFGRLLSRTMEAMPEAELTEHLGYERYEANGRNSGNSRNGNYPKANSEK